MIGFFIGFTVVLLMSSAFIIYFGKQQEKDRSKSRTLLIDDQRTIAADRVARTYNDGIKALTKEGPWETLLLDHDLGCHDEEGVEKTGYSIMCFLEENTQYLPNKIVIISSNPVGRQSMQVVIDKLYRDREDK
jgi:hypothetical protein